MRMKSILLQTETDRKARKDAIIIIVWDGGAAALLVFFFSSEATSKESLNNFRSHYTVALYSAGGKSFSSEITTYIRQVSMYDSSDNRTRTTWREWTIIAWLSTVIAADTPCWHLLLCCANNYTVLIFFTLQHIDNNRKMMRMMIKIIS